MEACIVMHDGHATWQRDACSRPTYMARAIDARTRSEHIALLVCALNFWLWYCVPPTRKQQPAAQRRSSCVLTSAIPVVSQVHACFSKAA